MNKKIIISLILSITGLVLILLNRGIDIDEDDWCWVEMNWNKISKEGYFYENVEFNDPNYFLTAKDRENYTCIGYTHDDHRQVKILLEKKDIDYLGSDNFNRRWVLIGVIILVISLIVIVIEIIRSFYNILFILNANNKIPPKSVECS